MNTVEKGDKLEQIIHDVFSEDIANGSFWANKDCCKIFIKKGYYSKDREKDIIFDISIEIYLPGQENYSVLVLIECKNYNHKVPVDDVEEFYAKTQQISGANIKAIVASTNSFQDGTFKFSKSKGIGLLRYFSKEKREWVLTRSPSVINGRSKSKTEKSTVSIGLTQQEHISTGFDFYCYTGNCYSNYTRIFFSDLILSDLDNSEKKAWDAVRQTIPNNYPSVNFLDISVIESKCSKLLHAIKYLNGPVSFDKIKTFLLNTYRFKLNLNTDLGIGVLGNINFKSSVINIDNSQCETEARVRFTIAHELGHFFLEHSQFMVEESCYDSHLVSEERKDLSIPDIMRMEWQANQFASCLLLPKKTFIKAFEAEAKRRGIINKGFGPLFVDGQKCNVTSMIFITSHLMKKFMVSKTVVIIRMKQLGIMQ
ncbi:ImmA/IrrE family metallo-endopeptidase [Pseudocolwellia sp. AS88]|uniref:ImmA/IrrE family metallo-endopeptidase n=1 Tax=Pseudocolwellia sp. AS88 TaxID=3063958 RepID=UPI0026EE5977|nr:ImmA/IrrE family metallo-endopeptidase [Pseudocolwellia sp. AS88]MDO7084888.1 ImmA/IrrE family metallo-endopeptidase [Pseudocolwellia sp. AS88]